MTVLLTAEILFRPTKHREDKIDKAILLVKKGADISVKNSEGFTPLLYAADRASTYERWQDAWRFVYYLLEVAKADYLYTTKDGRNLQEIVRRIRKDARENDFTLFPDFLRVTEWLAEHNIETEPLINQP